MPMLHPDSEPHDAGMLDVGDGNRIAWETCGARAGVPALVLHGGPGSGCSPHFRRFFDPAAYRIVLFDQRGCGRSRPHAADPATDLGANTTEHLLGDIERLRIHLGVERWLVFGTSWGSTLGLAYAERHPARVRALVLAAVATTRPWEIEWLYKAVAPLFPAEWERFRAGVVAADDADAHDLVEAYSRLLEDPDDAVRLRAARHFNAWDWALSVADPGTEPPATWAEPAFQVARARIVTHYFRHDAWLEDGALLRGAGALTGVPGVMVHGRLDLASPLATAWALARAWPDAELVVVPRAGHTLGAEPMAEAVVVATDRFRS
ncbi:MAG: prolyl aminopeptidase [Acidimicrobiales bacterium]